MLCSVYLVEETITKHALTPNWLKRQTDRQTDRQAERQKEKKHPHAQLIQLVPLLGQAHCAVLRVSGRGNKHQACINYPELVKETDRQTGRKTEREEASSCTADPAGPTAGPGPLCWAPCI